MIVYCWGSGVSGSLGDGREASSSTSVPVATGEGRLPAGGDDPPVALAADYNLSPSQYVEVGERAAHRPLPDILADLRAAREAREAADARLAEVLARLGL